MTTLREYYGDAFRSDLASVISSSRSTHLRDPNPAMQPRTLSTENPVIRSWNAERKGLFAAALFITILSDQVCYTHFGDHYQLFRALTMYPKLKGDCPGGCDTNIHPSSVFGAIGKAPGAWPRSNGVDYAALPRDLFAVLREEIHSFFPSHVRQVQPDEFLRQCERSMPGGFTLLLLAAWDDEDRKRGANMIAGS